MTWFRNLRVYRLGSWAAPDDAALQEQLAAQALAPCGRLEPASVGWQSPYGRDDDRLAHTANGCHLLRFGIQERVLPPAVLREQVAERVRAFRERTGQRPGRRQLVGLRDEVMMDLLPRAFVKPVHTDCYLDPAGGWLAVDAAGARRAEEVAALLRQTFPGLRLARVDAPNRIRTHLTRWLSAGRCPEELALGEECDLRDDADARSTVRCRHLELDSEEVRQHLAAGRHPVLLGLRWNERLAFSLGEDFSLLRIKALEVLTDQLEDLAAEDDLARLDAEFALMALELRALLAYLVAVLELDEPA